MLDIYYAFKLTNFPDKRNSMELIVFRREKILTNPQLREYQRTKTISSNLESLSTKYISSKKYSVDRGTPFVIVILTKNYFSTIWFWGFQED